MGSERFRLSDTMVSSWFNKLKGMRRANGRRSITHDGKQGDFASATLKPPPKQKQQEGYLPNRSSYYYSSRERTEKLPHSPINTKASDTSFPVESPRMFDQRPRRGHPKASVKSISPAGTAGCTCHSNLGSVRKYGVVPDRSACFDHSSSVSSAFEGFEDMSEVNLPPILTRPSKKDVHNEELNSTGTRRTTPRKRTLRIKVRPRSLRTSGKRSQKSCTLEAAVPRFAVQQQQQQQQQQKKDISDSLIVVMLSSDPQRDFRASMLEMIAENDITRPKDLEQLLACYLSLNSEEYHGIIIQVFKQIWFDLMLI